MPKIPTPSMDSVREYPASALRARVYPFECMPVLSAPIITSPGSIASPNIMRPRGIRPTTAPARSNVNSSPAKSSGMMAVSPPTMGTWAIFAPATRPRTMSWSISALFVFAAI